MFATQPITAPSSKTGLRNLLLEEIGKRTALEATVTRLCLRIEVLKSRLSSGLEENLKLEHDLGILVGYLQELRDLKGEGEMLVTPPIQDLKKSMKLKDLYFEKFSRDEAVKYLTGKPPRSYILRKSSQKDCFAMSFVSDKGTINHNLIVFRKGKYFMQQGDGTLYHSVEEVLKDFGFLK